ncbi:hypothetical protein [Desulfobaculum bizertense]|uniref:hypothetical protein n=1 Tax=Desulfobaculum bizertense TaxID=376490 RepID=UPI00202B22D5
MDDDTVVSPDSLSNLLDAATKLDDNFGFLSSQVQWTDSSLCEMNVQMFKNRKLASIIKNKKKELVKCDQASFVSLLIKTETIEHIGLPFKEFFIWGMMWNTLDGFQKS